MLSSPLIKTAEKTITLIDAISEWSGKTASWLVLGMTLLVTYDVTMRYLFQSGSVALQELEWHLFALIFLLGAAYTFKHNDHVRIDLFYQSKWMNDRRRAWVSLLGDIVLLIPFCLLIIYYSAPFVDAAFVHAEKSPDPGGLPARWLLKAAIPTGFGLLLLQGLGDAMRQTLTLFGSSARNS